MMLARARRPAARDRRPAGDRRRPRRLVAAAADRDRRRVRRRRRPRRRPQPVADDAAAVAAAAAARSARARHARPTGACSRSRSLPVARRGARLRPRAGAPGVARRPGAGAEDRRPRTPARRLRLRNVFVVGQVTMSLLLVIVAGAVHARAAARGEHPSRLRPGARRRRDARSRRIGGITDEDDGAGFVRDLLERVRGAARRRIRDGVVDLPLDGGRMGLGIR